MRDSILNEQESGDDQQDTLNSSSGPGKALEGITLDDLKSPFSESAHDFSDVSGSTHDLSIEAAEMERKLVEVANALEADYTKSRESIESIVREREKTKYWMLEAQGGDEIGLGIIDDAMQEEWNTSIPRDGKSRMDWYQRYEAMSPEEKENFTFPKTFVNQRTELTADPVPWEIDVDRENRSRAPMLDLLVEKADPFLGQPLQAVQGKTNAQSVIIMEGWREYSLFDKFAYKAFEWFRKFGKTQPISDGGMRSMGVAGYPWSVQQADSGITATPSGGRMNMGADTSTEEKIDRSHPSNGTFGASNGTFGASKEINGKRIYSEWTAQNFVARSLTLNLPSYFNRGYHFDVETDARHDTATEFMAGGMDKFMQDLPAWNSKDFPKELQKDGYKGARVPDVYKIAAKLVTIFNAASEKGNIMSHAFAPSKKHNPTHHRAISMIQAKKREVRRKFNESCQELDPFKFINEQLIELQILQL